MMRNKNRWLASVLTISLALGDCGGMTALAEERNAITESTVSENTSVLDEAPENDAGKNADDNVLPDSSEETKETNIKLPALHIGQIAEYGTLPTADDDTFIYDLPVSFEMSENLILFVNYDIDPLPESKENGILEWSILRGEKGMEPGSTILLDTEDDWHGFEEVPSSPCFSMEKIADTESGCNQMMALTPKEAADDEMYDYYIRAAYYPENEEGKAENFYAASTIPFVPLKMSAIGQDIEDVSDIEEIPADNTSSDVSVSENTTDLTDDDAEISEDSPADVLLMAGNSNEDTAESTGSENTVADQTVETFSTLSENSTMSDVSLLSDEGVVLSETEKAEVTSITLSETQTLTMQPTGPDNTKQITATVTVEPLSSASPPLLWESSNETVATVEAGANGTAVITAVAEGYTAITASCGGKTASVTVDVVPDKNNPDSDKLLDLSGDIRIAGFERESDSFVYTGQRITQNLRVYYNEKQLTEKTDYTLNYKNNINAAEWNTAKAPSVTINLKGQYQGSVTLYYTIKPLDINKINIDDKDGTKTPGYEQAVNYSKNINIPAPVLTFGNKKLTAKKDFVCDYTLLTEELGGKDYKKGDSYDYENGKVYHYTVSGAGNYTGSFQMQFVILDKAKNFSTASVKLDKNKYNYCGTPLRKTDVHIEEVKIGSQVLAARDYDYEICANGIEGAYLTVSPTESGRTAGYRGCKKVNLKLAGDRKIGDAVFGANWKDEITFSQQTVDKTGGIFQEKTDLLRFGSDTLVEGTDYTIKYGNAKKAGTVTVTFKGIGRYTGSVSKKYKITPNIDSRNLTVVWGKNVTKKADGSLEIPYQKNGATPEFYIRDENYVVLNSKTDYTVQLSDNKKPKNETQKDMTCTIKGKGNYKGYEKVVTLTVTTADISQATITVADKPYDSKPNKWKAGVTVTDTNGKKLAAGTDYIKEIDYTYANMNPTDSTAVPPVNTVVTVKIKGTGFYEGELTGTYRIYDKAKDIGKLKIGIDPQTYTGEEIKLKKTDIHVYATAADQKAKKELNGKDSCFEIIESTYKNNIKTGTAKVTLHGIGEYGGTKTYSFKIQKKVYVVNRVKGIKLDKTALTLSMIELQEAEDNGNAAAGRLTATITSQTAEKITNPTVIWSSSNSNIAAVEVIQDSTPGIDNTTGAATSTSIVRIKAKQGGSVTITATTQDGNMRAQCKVSITNQPVLIEAGQAIKANIGGTYQLHLKYAQEDTPINNTGDAKWESSNPEAVSVDNSGMLTMKKAGTSVITVSISKYNFTAQCYAVAIDPNEKAPEGKVLTYEQQAGTADDTPYINRLLRDWEQNNPSKYDCMYIPAGVYHIDAAPGGTDQFGQYKFGGIILTENQTLIMSSSAILITIGNSQPNTRVIWAFGRDNVTISGGQIIGERHKHNGTSGEWGHGIEISGCTNVTIENVDISQCWGDGIYLGQYNEKASSDVTITNCNLHHNRRNSLSITDAGNITIKNCQFNYAGGHNGQPGHDPQYGIDIEPNIPGYVCRNIKIYDSEFKGNTKASMGIIKAADGVTLENCTLDGPFYNKAGKNVVLNGKAVPIN